jgi:hypothetical protein
MNPANDWKWRLALGAFALFAGFVWFWPPPAPPPPAPAPPPVAVEEPEEFADSELLHYTVQEDDTAHSIARLFVVDEALLRRVNRIPPGDDFAPGAHIRIPPQTP